MPTTAMMIERLIEMRTDPDGAPVDQFWMLAERFRADLVNQAYCLLGNQQDAEDVAQESLCKAFVDLDQLRDPTKLGFWLREINRRMALNLRRKRCRSREERLATGQLTAISSPEEEADPLTDPIDKVLQAVDSLQTNFREVIVMRYWERLSNEEIAMRLGIPAATVRSRLARADRMLAVKLKVLMREDEHPR